MNRFLVRLLFFIVSVTLATQSTFASDLATPITTPISLEVIEKIATHAGEKVVEKALHKTPIQKIVDTVGLKTILFVGGCVLIFVGYKCYFASEKDLDKMKDEVNNNTDKSFNDVETNAKKEKKKVEDEVTSVQKNITTAQQVVIDIDELMKQDHTFVFSKLKDVQNGQDFVVGLIMKKSEYERKLIDLADSSSQYDEKNEKEIETITTNLDKLDKIIQMAREKAEKINKNLDNAQNYNDNTQLVLDNMLQQYQPKNNNQSNVGPSSKPNNQNLGLTLPSNTNSSFFKQKY